jgi:hypothetical protein
VTTKQKEVEPMAYVARCKCGCGGIIMATMDLPDLKDDNANEIADCIRVGHTIERHTPAWV